MIQKWVYLHMLHVRKLTKSSKEIFHMMEYAACYMHVILMWPKIRTKNWIRYENESNFEHSQNLRTKRNKRFQNFDTWSIFRAEIKQKPNGSNFELSQNHMQIESCDKSPLILKVRWWRMLGTKYVGDTEQVRRSLNHPMVIFCFIKPKMTIVILSKYNYT